MGTLTTFLLIKHIWLKKSFIIINKFHLRLAVLYYYFEISLICFELFCSKDMKALDFKNNTSVIVFLCPWPLVSSVSHWPLVSLFLSTKTLHFFQYYVCGGVHIRESSNGVKFLGENMHTFYLNVFFLISEKTFNISW